MRDPVPYDKVELLAAQVRELMRLRDHQAQVQAKLVRWCVWALRKGPPDDRAKALLYLEWLATQLENQPSGNLTPNQPKENPDVHGSEIA